MNGQNNKFLLILLHNHLVLSLAAVLLSFISQVQMGRSPEFYTYHGLIFGACMSEYNLHKFIKFYNLNLNDRHIRYKWLNNNQRIAWGFTIFSLLLAFVSFLFVGNEVKLIFLASAAIVILYSLPVSGWTGYISLRKIPFLKTVLVALIWSVVTVLIPAAAYLSELSFLVIILNFIGRFLLIFTLALLFDIRDMNTDNENRIRTIPAVFGRNFTLQLVLPLLIMFIIVNYVSVGSDLTDYRFISGLLISILLMVLIYNSRISSSPYYYSLFLDGTLIIYSLMVLIGWFFLHQKGLFQ